MRDGNSELLLAAVDRLNDRLRGLEFGDPVSYVYLPTEYARVAHGEYVMRYGGGKKRVLMLGMNPGPWGMAQTGVPFGEVEIVREWMGIEEEVEKPEVEHPKRPVEGFSCRKSEVSGRRLWGLMRDRFGSAEEFFKDHFVVNYCPLVWMADTGRNITPDKVRKSEMVEVEAACREHLEEVLRITDPEWLVGVGAYAEQKLKEVAGGMGLLDRVKLGRVLHPSPASPVANRGWEPQAERQLVELGVWGNGE